LYMEGKVLRLSVSCRRSTSSSLSPRVGICEMAVSERSLEHRDTWLRPSYAKETHSYDKSIAHGHKQWRTLTLPCATFGSLSSSDCLSIDLNHSFFYVMSGTRVEITDCSCSNPRPFLEALGQLV
jgi:hypothetical protein